MNSIFSHKNLTKKISIFFLVFFIFLSFFNSSKAQNINPSDLQLYSYIESGVMGGSSQTVTTSFKKRVEVYIKTAQQTSNGEVRLGANSTSIKNLVTEINSLPSQFDSSFTALVKNTGNLGVGVDNTNTIVGVFLLKKILSDEINNINKVKASLTNNNEKNIADDLIKKMRSDLSSYTSDIDSSGTLTRANYKYQLSPDGTKVINTTNIDANSGSGWFSNSYQDIVNKIISAIDAKADDTSSQKNVDILNLKNTVTSSIITFNDTIKKIQSSLTNSSGVAITPDQQMLLAEKEVLTPIDDLIRSYLADTNNQKPGNEKIQNAYSSAKTVLESYLSSASSSISDAKINYNSTTNSISQNNKGDCDSEGFWKTAFSSNSNCSIGAYLINIMIQGINGLVNIIVSLVGAIFDWIYNNGVINFKSWVDGSGAYTIYKTIILSLIVSVMMFFVFYLIIRRLLDDDGEKMNKILPGLILTALFVYFSFTITGWIIDQSNIITIYLYRSMTHNAVPAQSIGETFKNILNIDNGGANSGPTGIAGNFGVSLGSWNAIPYTLGQLAVSIVGVFVLFEGAILILSRTIILLLCMIFSPLMLLPDGLTDFTDKYKKLVMDNFTGNVLLGPVFMFLVLIAVQIGQITTKMVGTGPTLDSAGVAVPTNFLGGIISSILVIVVLQLAISVSKSLSGSMGEKLSGVISKYAGGAAFGGGAKVLRNTIGRGAAIAKDKGWMMGKEGSTRHKFMSTLYNGAAKSTFDARNTSGFQQAADLSGAGAASFGKGSNKNFNDSFETKLYNANKYHGGLDESGKQRNITRLKNSVDIDNQRIAESLDKKWKPSINERLNNDSDYSKRFDKAHNEKDQAKRKTETEKIVNEHFKENGQGAEHFSKEIQKAENNKIKQDYDKALAEKDPEERKKQLTKVIADLDKKTSPNEGSVPSLTESLEAAEVQNDNSDFEEENTINKKQGRVQRLLNNRLLNKTGGSLSGLRNENLMNSFNKVNQKMNEQTKQIAEDEQTRLKEEEQLRINTTPTAQDLSAQTSLKNKLKERNKSKRSDDNDEPNDDGPSTPSPTGSGKPEIGNSMSVNETGRLRPMYSPEEIATLNKNRESGGEGDKKAA